MARFYFHYRGDGGPVADPEGSEHADLEAAIAEAIRGARDIMADEIKSGQLRLERWFEIHDANDRPLARVDFAEAIRPSPPTGPANPAV